MVGLQSLDLPIGVRIPVSQPKKYPANISLPTIRGGELKFAGQGMDGWHETEIRVRYAETDQMGIAHHANFLIWFETGRSELCRARGFSYKEMEDEAGALMVVAEVYCRYKSPAFYEDILKVRTKVIEIRSRSLRFFYEIRRSVDDILIAEGETLHVVTDRDKKVRKLPETYRKLLSNDQEKAFPADQAPN